LVWLALVYSSTFTSAAAWHVKTLIILSSNRKLARCLSLEMSIGLSGTVVYKSCVPKMVSMLVCMADNRLFNSLLQKRHTRPFIFSSAWLTAKQASGTCGAKRWSDQNTQTLFGSTANRYPPSKLYDSQRMPSKLFFNN
jgi:hypothetical protein